MPGTRWGAGAALAFPHRDAGLVALDMEGLVAPLFVRMTVLQYCGFATVGALQLIASSATGEDVVLGLDVEQDNFDGHL